MTIYEAIQLDNLLDGNCVFIVLKEFSTNTPDITLKKGEYLAFDDLEFESASYGPDISSTSKDNPLNLKETSLVGISLKLYALKRDEHGNHVVVEQYLDK